MKQFKFLSMIIVIAAMVSTACGAPPAPTMSAADVQFTAVAAAFTIVAETQAAIPTATPLPPSETPTVTPPPTNTPAELPTLAVSLTPVPPTSGGDPCDNRQLSSAPNGRPTKLAIINTTKIDITVSVYLNETADKGECGWWTFNLGRKGNTVRDSLVQGCYNIWAWSQDGKVNANGSGCPNNNDKWSFEISAQNIKFVGP